MLIGMAQRHKLA